MPHCRICKVEIDREKDDWIMPSKNWYYHRKCYTDWKESTPATDEEYRAFIFDFIARDLKVPYDYHKCKAQIDKFVKEGRTVKGIFFTLKYFYEIKKGDWNKGYGGIGIVPYVYNEACTYWTNQERKTKGIVADIERQMRAAAERKHMVVRKAGSKPRQFEVDFSVLDDLEDDE